MLRARPSASLPHTGIATFCKAPYVFDITAIDSDIVILGVPFDGMASMRPGCRQAPRALRDASARFGWLEKARGSGGSFEFASQGFFSRAGEFSTQETSTSLWTRASPDPGSPNMPASSSTERDFWPRSGVIIRLVFR